MDKTLKKYWDWEYGQIQGALETSLLPIADTFQTLLKDGFQIDNFQPASPYSVSSLYTVLPFTVSLQKDNKSLPFQFGIQTHGISDGGRISLKCSGSQYLDLSPKAQTLVSNIVDSFETTSEQPDISVSADLIQQVESPDIAKNVKHILTADHAQYWGTPSPFYQEVTDLKTLLTGIEAIPGLPPSIEILKAQDHGVSKVRTIHNIKIVTETEEGSNAARVIKQESTTELPYRTKAPPRLVEIALNYFPEIPEFQNSAPKVLITEAKTDQGPKAHIRCGGYSKDHKSPAFYRTLFEGVAAQNALSEVYHTLKAIKQTFGSRELG